MHEPQVEGRLHGHFGIYGSVLNPELFTRVAAGPKFLQDKLANILDSITTTHLSPNVRNWWEDCRSKRSTVPMPRAADIAVPHAHEDYTKFINVSERKEALTNNHEHGFTCEKPPKGLYM